MATNQSNKNLNIGKPEPYMFLDVTNTVKYTTNIRDQILNAVAGRLLDRLWWDPSYGVQVQEKLSRFNIENISILETMCENEIVRDERIQSCKVQITLLDPNGTNGTAIISVSVLAKSLPNQPIQTTINVG